MSVRSYIHAIALRPKFWSHLPSYVARGLQLLWIRWTGRQTTFGLQFGVDQFRLHFHPLGQGQGSQGVFFFREHYEPLLEFGHRFIARGATVLDVGSSQGVFACAFGAAVGSGGRVLAVEPIPWQAGRVRENADLNGFNQITVEEAAVSDVIGTSPLDLSGGDTSASLVTTASSADQSIEVGTTTLDELARRHRLTSVEFVKLDAEGSELNALKGGRAMIDRDRPVICVEAYDKALYENVLAELAVFDYAPFVFDANGGLEPFTQYTGYEANVFFVPVRR